MQGRDTPSQARSAAPEWLAGWRSRPVGPAEALARFDRLAGVEPEGMLGRWRGSGLPTGHPLDWVLEGLGWYGKAFERLDRVHPLLFRDRSGRIASLDPALMPVGIGLRWPGLARGAPARAAFSALRPLLRTGRPAARLCRLEFRGRSSAAMVYDRQPITDHFRRIDEERVLGLMDTRGALPPWFFLLVRVAGDGPK